MPLYPRVFLPFRKRYNDVVNRIFLDTKVCSARTHLVKFKNLFDSITLRVCTYVQDYKARIHKHMHKQLLSWTLIRFVGGWRGEGEGVGEEAEEGERFPGRAVKARVAISAEAASRFALWARAARPSQSASRTTKRIAGPNAEGENPARSTSNIFYFFHLDLFNRARADENNWTMNGRCAYIRARLSKFND